VNSTLIYDPVMPECFAHACRQAPGEPGYGISGIQFYDKRITLAVFLDSRYAQSTLRAGARMAKTRGNDDAVRDRKSTWKLL
jgi:hypothetical protein